MKRLLLLLMVALLSAGLFADELVKIPVKDFEQTKQLIKSNGLIVHHYNDDFVIATATREIDLAHELLVNDPWVNTREYHLVWFDKEAKENYLGQLSDIATVHYSTAAHALVKVKENRFPSFFPQKHGGIVTIENEAVTLPNPDLLKGARLDLDPEIVEMMEQVSADTIEEHIQHLQDYGTRNCYKSQSFEAQDWIEAQFQSYGLETEIMDFYMSGGEASDNVIATLPGTAYPNEYVVIGGHYDSYCFSNQNDAPGADDNASGTTGVMEVARIMSDYEFDRTIIFIAFSGEEYGLYGSEAYAELAEDEGMNILGYLNMDMIAYRHQMNPIHTDLIHPSSAQELADFYTDVCAEYLPDFGVEEGTLIGGDSDHSSFNDHGYMGIFPFEDSDNYSPYIHSTDDILGLSANSMEMAATFTQAIIASGASLANLLLPPQNLVGIPGDNQVELMWDDMVDIDGFNVYRNGGNEPIATVNEPYYLDQEVENGTEYTYYVTAIYSQSGEESASSNEVTVTPMPPITFPFAESFESGAPYWSLEETWGLTSSEAHTGEYSLTESPGGDYQDNLEIVALLNPINLQIYEEADLSFWTKYNIESGWDYMYLEITTNGTNWTELAEYTGSQYSWTQKQYSLDNYVGEPFVQIRFRFYSDYWINEDGMYIDDLEIIAEGGVQTQALSLVENYQFVSTRIIPQEPDMTEVLSGIMDSELNFVRNSDGNMLQKIGPNWVNGIGDWQTEEGYLFHMYEGAPVSVEGTLMDPQTPITLSTGYQFVSYLPATTMNAMDAFESIMNDNLAFVRASDGSMLRKIGPNWVNNIGNTNPGEGYLIKMNADDELVYPSSFTKSLADAKPQLSYFEKVSGNPAQPVYTIYLEAGNGIETGDEVAAFANGKLVGSMVIQPGKALENDLVAFAVIDEENGYIPGDQIVLRLWDKSRNEEAALETNYTARFTGAHMSPSYPASDGEYSLVKINKIGAKTDEQAYTLELYPNPVKSTLHITSNEDIRKITLYNLAGQKVKEFSPSSNTMNLDMDDTTKGIYIIRVFTAKRVITKRLIVE